jgi:putative ABC transport system substrate-binding protein
LTRPDSLARTEGYTAVTRLHAFWPYLPDLPEMYKRAVTYIDKILKGAKAGDLPIERPSRFRFVINLKTAKALSLTIPHSLLLRADQVIE